ncbi:MAG: hypothetical protein AAB400_00075 [Patescibacteria group bacterium]
MRIFTAIGFLLPAVIDVIVTLVGQPPGYWQNYQAVQEGSPGGLALLSIHPGLFIVVFSVYVALTAFILLRWKNAYTLIFGIAVFTGHAWGSSSWIPVLFHGLNWYSMIVYFILISLPLGIALNREMQHTVLSK